MDRARQTVRTTEPRNAAELLINVGRRVHLLRQRGVSLDEASSMNPARTLASAVPSGVWTAIWVYFTAPPLGMLFGAQC